MGVHEGSQLAEMTGRWRRGLALSLVALVLWSTLPLALKAVSARMHPETITWYRYMASVTILTPIVLRRRLIPSGSLPARLTVLFAAALVGFTGNNVLYLMGLTYVSPSAGQVVIQLAPLLTMVGAVFVFKEHFSRLQWFGVTMLGCGMLAFFERQLRMLGGAGDGETIGVGLIMISAALWAAYALAQKVLLRHFDSLFVMWVNYTGGFLLLAPIVTPSEIRNLDGAGIAFLLYCCVNGLIGYGAFAESMVHWEASRVSAVVANAPLLTIAFTAIASRFLPAYVLPDRLTWLSLAGAAGVVLGSILAAGARRKPD